MAYIDKISVSDTRLTEKQFGILKRILKKNLEPNSRSSRGVFLRVARMSKPFGTTDDHKVLLDFARAESHTSRTVRAVNLIAEQEGMSGRLVDNAMSQGQCRPS